MKQTFKLTNILVVLSVILASCSAVGAYTPPIQAGAANAELSATPTSQVVAAATGSQPSQPAASSEAVSALQGVYENVYQQVNPSVVNIHVQQKVAASDIPAFDFFGQPGLPQDQIQRGLGSGFVWDNEGHIVTNNHVIDGADKVTVTFTDGTTVAGSVVGADLNSDLAVVKVDAPSNLLKSATLADSNQVKVGQMAIAIGNPYGLEGTMTVGIVSAIGRSLPVDSSNTSAGSPSYTIPDIIQTDAPINPGNSGGVLVNDQGDVIGITSAIESASGANAGIGFAVPSALVKKVIPVLIKNRKYQYPWLGISGQTLTGDLAKQMGLDANLRGILVGDVTSNGPADKAGIKGSSQEVTIDGLQAVIGGDVITRINDQELRTFDDMVSYLVNQTSVGETVNLSITRDKKEQTISVKLEARPSEQAANELASGQGQLPGNQAPQSPNQPRGRAQIGAAYLGITGTDITTEVAQSLKIDSSVKGVLVLTVIEGSPASQAGLKGSTSSQAGDIITSFDGQSVTSFTQLRSLISEKEGGDMVTLQVLRDGKTTSVEVTLAGAG